MATHVCDDDCRSNGCSKGEEFECTPGCIGWHIDDDGRVVRCDVCERFADDDEAIEAAHLFVTNASADRRRNPIAIRAVIAILEKHDVRSLEIDEVNALCDQVEPLIDVLVNVRGLLIKGRRWRDDVGGADFVQDVSTILDNAGLGTRKAPRARKAA